MHAPVKASTTGDHGEGEEEHRNGVGDDVGLGCTESLIGGVSGSVDWVLLHDRLGVPARTTIKPLQLSQKDRQLSLYVRDSQKLDHDGT